MGAVWSLEPTEKTGGLWDSPELHLFSLPILLPSSQNGFSWKESLIGHFHINPHLQAHL